MMKPDRAGFWRRLGSMLAFTLKRGTLGKSSHDARYHFTDSDGYWDRVIAAQQGWPEDHSPNPSPDPQYEPVHGWTKRQCDAYLLRNPGYRLAYETELKQCGRATTPDAAS